VLCGGLGTRIKNFSKGSPKILIPIFKKPFFYYLLKKFKKNGIKNIYLLTQYKSKQIENYVKNIKDFNFFIYKDGKKKLGTGGSLKKNLKNFPNYFFLTYGDSYLDIKYSTLRRKNLETDKSIISIYRNHKKFKNNILLKNKKILEYSKNKNFNYIDYGLFLFKKKHLEKFYIKNQRFDLGKYISFLIKKNNLSYVISKKKFNECGSLEGIKKIQKLIK
jgi:MurNAc alpha-1-phosphate uridylyltransferase